MCLFDQEIPSFAKASVRAMIMKSGSVRAEAAAFILSHISSKLTSFFKKEEEGDRCLS